MPPDSVRIGVQIPRLTHVCPSRILHATNTFSERIGRDTVEDVLMRATLWSWSQATSPLVFGVNETDAGPGWLG